MRLLWLAAIASTALAAPAWAQDAQQGADIVVTGTPLDETARRLAACLERHCPPKEDIDASLAHAENQFVAGDYAGARSTLSKSVRRNEGYRRTLPVEVSDLQRAYGRMIDVGGRPDSARIIQIDSLDSLKAGLDPKDRRVFLQRTLVADQFAQNGRPRAAEDLYVKVEREAAAAGLPQVSAYALLRRASLLGALATYQPEYKSRYHALLDRLETLPGDDMLQFRLSATVLRAADAARRHDDAGLDSIVAGIDARQFPRPYLLYAPTILIGDIGPSKMPLSGAPVPPHWADFRITIRPDGRVESAEILRQTPDLEKRWIRKINESVLHRRYTPYTPGAGAALATRIERFSFVQDWSNNDGPQSNGSRIRGQKADIRLAWIDLTPPDAQPSAPPKDAGS